LCPALCHDPLRRASPSFADYRHNLDRRKSFLENAFVDDQRWNSAAVNRQLPSFLADSTIFSHSAWRAAFSWAAAGTMAQIAERAHADRIMQTLKTDVRT